MLGTGHIGSSKAEQRPDVVTSFVWSGCQSRDPCTMKREYSLSCHLYRTTLPTSRCLVLVGSQPPTKMAFGNLQTWLDLLDNRLAVTVSHLPDVQQVVRIPIVWWPKVYKDPGPTAPTINNHPVIQRWVICVRCLQGMKPFQVPARGMRKIWN